MHDKTVSIAKGVGISLMVIGHSGSPELLFRFIYLFHMPLFFFLSGYLFKSDYLDKKKLFVQRRIKGLYLPYIKWQLLFLALHGLFYRWHFYAADYTVADYLDRGIRILLMYRGEQLLGGYWYLSQAFISSILALGILYVVARFIKWHQAVRNASSGGLISTFAYSGGGVIR